MRFRAPGRAMYDLRVICSPASLRHSRLLARLLVATLGLMLIPTLACGRDWGSVKSWVYQLTNYKDDKLDALAASSSVEADPAKRKALIKQVFLAQAEATHYIPLHRQIIPWAARANVEVVHRADNWVETRWVVVKLADPGVSGGPVCLPDLAA